MNIINQVCNLFILCMLVSAILWVFRSSGLILFYYTHRILGNRFGYVREYGHITFKVLSVAERTATPDTFLAHSNDIAYKFVDETLFIGMHDRPFVPCEALMKVKRGNIVGKIFLLDDTDIYDYMHEQYIIVCRYVFLIMGGLYLCFLMLDHYQLVNLPL